MISLGIQDQGLYSGTPSLFLDLTHFVRPKNEYDFKDIVMRIKSQSLKSRGRQYNHVVLRNADLLGDEDAYSLTYHLCEKNNFAVTIEQTGERCLRLHPRCLISIQLQHVDTRDPFRVQTTLNTYHKRHLVALRCFVANVSQIPDWDRFIQWLRVAKLCPVYLIPVPGRLYCALSKAVKDHCIRMNYLFCDKLDQKIGNIKNE